MVRYPCKSMKEQDLIRLQPVLEILQAAIWSGRLCGEAPISLCLVANSQSAKSECLKYFSLTTSLKLLTDVTSRGLMAQVRLIERRQLRHIVIMDLHVVVSHCRFTADRTLLMMGALMEEGLAGIADAGGELTFGDLPKIGVLMAITPDFYHARRGHWRKTGFLSRFLTVHYTYCESTKDHIHVAIARDHHLPDPRNEEIPEEGQEISIPDQQAGTLMSLSQGWGREHLDPAFRFHRQLRRLTKARALINGRHSVTNDDIAKITAWMPFFNQTRAVEL